jgi:Zn-dependent protease
MSKNKPAGFFPAALAIFAKGGKLLSVLKLFKVAKPLVLLVSMSISVIAYAFWLGPWLSVLFVGLLLIHEMGHVAAMKIKGFATPTPVFIPFLGAAVFAPSFGDRDTEAFVGYGGPFLGTLGCLASFATWFTLPHGSPMATVVLVGSYLGTYLNLFNLIPISPLDGGRVTQAGGAWFKYAGLIGLAGFSIWFRQPVILYVWILVLFDLTMIPVKTRAVILSLLWISMATLMALGYGTQPWWINLLDCILTSLFVIVSIKRAFRTIVDATPDIRPQLVLKQRVKWIGAYAGLATVLAIVLAVQIHYLPAHF